MKKVTSSDGGIVSVTEKKIRNFVPFVSRYLQYKRFIIVYTRTNVPVMFNISERIIDDKRLSAHKYVINDP